jgi:hypothetical protein
VCSDLAIAHRRILLERLLVLLLKVSHLRVRENREGKEQRRLTFSVFFSSDSTICWCTMSASFRSFCRD